MSAYDLGTMIPLEDGDELSVGATIILNETGVFIASSVYQADDDDGYETVVSLQEVGENERLTKTFSHDAYSFEDNRAELFASLLVTTVSEDGDWEALFSDEDDDDDLDYAPDDLDAEEEVLGGGI